MSDEGGEKEYKAKNLSKPRELKAEKGLHGPLLRLKCVHKARGKSSKASVRAEREICASLAVTRLFI